MPPLLFGIEGDPDPNPSECSCPVDSRLPPAGRRQLHNFLSLKGKKMQIESGCRPAQRYKYHLYDKRIHNLTYCSICRKMDINKMQNVLKSTNIFHFIR